jgi:hypothetical protein
MKIIGKTLLAYFILAIAAMLSGVILPKMALSPPTMPPGTTPAGLSAAVAVGSAILIVGLVPIASGIGGTAPTRWSALGLMLYVATGINTVIELTIFSTMGGRAYLLAQDLIVFGAATAALGWLFGTRQSAPSFPQFTLGSWAWRIGVAWLAFPLIYLIFGMCVGPFVTPYYTAGFAGLRLPPLDVIMRVQLLRSLLFLGSSLPVIMLWTGSRRRLIFALGLAHAVMVGLYGLAAAYWLPPILRVLHSLEITADSFAYAFVLVSLFVPRTRTAAVTSVHSTATPAASH